MKKIECNGYKIPFNSFTKEVRDSMVIMIDKTRPIFLKENANKFEDFEFYVGSRFNDNYSVKLRIMSAATQEEFEKNIVEWIWAGLEECAKSDAYYMFEKRWE